MVHHTDAVKRSEVAFIPFSCYCKPVFYEADNRLSFHVYESRQVRR